MKPRAYWPDDRTTGVDGSNEIWFLSLTFQLSYERRLFWNDTQQGDSAASLLGRNVVQTGKVTGESEKCNASNFRANHSKKKSEQALRATRNFGDNSAHATAYNLLETWIFSWQVRHTHSLIVGLTSSPWHLPFWLTSCILCFLPKTPR